MGNPTYVTIRRTRKYRIDPLVHVALVNVYQDRSYKIICTNFWVYSRQVTQVDEAVTCLSCITKDTQ